MAVFRMGFDCDDHFDLDRGVPRQLRDTHGTTGMTAGLAK
jgi:hypothetical protein